MQRSKPEDFWARVDIRGEDECWLWTGYVVQGYGLLKFSMLDPSRNPTRAHRVAWALTKGNGFLPSAEWAIHHTCENKLCVNPAHLESLSKSEHHSLHGANVPKTSCEIHDLVKDKWGHCRECHRAYQREWAQRVRPWERRPSWRPTSQVT